MWTYATVSDAEAGRNRWFIVDEVSDLLIPQLKIPPPAPHFIVRAVDGDIFFEDYDVGGLCDPEGLNIYLRFDLTPMFLAKAVAHELRHAWQKKYRPYLSNAQAERCAEFYELELLRQLGFPREQGLVRALATTNDKLRDESAVTL